MNCKTNIRWIIGVAVSLMAASALIIGITQIAHSAPGQKNIISIVLPPFFLDPTSQPQHAGEIGPEQAQQAGYKIVAQLGLPAPSGRTELDLQGLEIRVWSFQCAQYQILLDPRTGELENFSNYQREGEQVKGIGRNVPYQIRTRAAAAQVCWRYALRMGMPHGARLVKLTFRDEADPRGKDSNRAGYIKGRFELPAPGGYPYHRLCAPGALVVADPRDGMLVFYGQEWHIKPIPPVRKLTRQQAIARAEALYYPYLVHQNTRSGFFLGSRYPTGASLEYVTPGAYIQGMLKNGKDMLIPLSINKLLYAHLAWVVHFKREEVWIDATTGKELGAEVGFA